MILASCKQNATNKEYKPESTGPVNAVTVVMSNELWQGEVGLEVRRHFAEPCFALMPEQPIFSLTQIPEQIFRGPTLRSRAVIKISLDTTNLAMVKNDLYATDQTVVEVTANTHQGLIDGINQIAKPAIGQFKANELMLAQKRFNRALSKDETISQLFGIRIKIPALYRLGLRGEKFAWFDRDIPNGHLNVLVYEMPSSAFTVDSLFIKNIIAMRDSIGKLYIPGENPGTYMITEQLFSPLVFPVEIGQMKGAEIRGIWEVKGYPMAGPFLTYILNDKERNRKLVLEGFAYAPNTPKRELMHELEAILKTASF